jgi:hypothetical protein
MRLPLSSLRVAASNCNLHPGGRDRDRNIDRAKVTFGQTQGSGSSKQEQLDIPRKIPVRSGFLQVNASELREWSFKKAGYWAGITAEISSEAMLSTFFGVTDFTT